ncbi:MAG: Maf family protein, partial [Paludibacteraceae bacterium]|nr:Maf family protein [Paludibacteraceae bacterium]
MLENYKVILASTSPRRRELLKGLELNFECASPLTDDESYPDTLLGGEIPMYIASKKADSMLPKM